MYREMNRKSCQIQIPSLRPRTHAQIPLLTSTTRKSWPWTSVQYSRGRNLRRRSPHLRLIQWYFRFGLQNLSPCRQHWEMQYWKFHRYWIFLLSDRWGEGRWEGEV